MELLLATHNQGKATELRTLLSELGWQVLTPNQVSTVSDLDVVEDGSTVAENAVKKAVAFGTAAKLLTLADDTGLEVAALDGQPGVHAKRYGATASERNQRLITALLLADDRSARFVTCLCLYDPQSDSTVTFEGELVGRIATKEAQQEVMAGVGYDTVFIPAGYSQTLAELGPEKKQQISHRRRALDKVVAYLESHYDRS